MSADQRDPTIPTQWRLTRQISAHWGTFTCIRRHPPHARLSLCVHEQTTMHAQTHKSQARAQDSAIRPEMQAVEPGSR